MGGWAGSGPAWPDAAAVPGALAPAQPGAGTRPMIALGQFRDTFIIAVDQEGIAIIDQHVAHERVLFEQVMARLGAGRLESQRLLEPLLVELSLAGRQALAAHAPELERFGFEVEEFGGDSVRVAAVPALLSPGESITAVRALADDLEGLDRGGHVGEALRRIAATTACHAAVKANSPLTYEKMAQILDELGRTAYSTVCPHGRPVMLRLTRREIETQLPAHLTAGPQRPAERRSRRGARPSFAVRFSGFQGPPALQPPPDRLLEAPIGRPVVAPASERGGQAFHGRHTVGVVVGVAVALAVAQILHERGRGVAQVQRRRARPAG